jgi:hypothetical protein
VFDPTVEPTADPSLFIVPTSNPSTLKSYPGVLESMKGMTHPIIE